MQHNFAQKKPRKSAYTIKMGERDRERDDAVQIVHGMLLLSFHMLSHCAFREPEVFAAVGGMNNDSFVSGVI